MLQNQRISTDTPFKTNTLSDSPFVSFPGFHEISHEAIKANEGGKNLLLEILRCKVSRSDVKVINSSIQLTPSQAAKLILFQGKSHW